MHLLNFLFAPPYLFENVIPNFFPARCFIFFENFLFTSFPYFTHESVEHVIHVPPVRRARLIEGTSELLGQVLALPGIHRPHGGLEVHLVCYEDHGDILGGSHLGDKVPIFYSLVKTVSLCDAVAYDEPLPAPHVLLPHRGELHLARRVQDVQQTRLGIYHSPLLIRVLNGGIMVVDEVVLDILESERGLTHSAVTEHHNAVPPEATRAACWARHDLLV